MPGLVKSQGALATKVLTMFPNNAEEGLPSHNALILLHDAATGVPIAVSGE